MAVSRFMVKKTMNRETILMEENIMKIEYEFEIDQKVMTPFDELGIITMLAFDESGQLYYVKTKSNSDWFKEKELKSLK